MADRRMFALDVIDSDKFLDMTNNAQLLYFHLSMMADDDGIVSKPKGIMRQCGMTVEILNELAVNGYIIPLESGVVAITHWKMSNQIRGDRYHPTIYRDEVAGLVADEIGIYTNRSDVEEIKIENTVSTVADDKENTVPTVETEKENAVPTVESEKENAVPTIETEKENAVPTVCSPKENTATEVSIGKVSLGKVSIDIEREDEDTSRRKTEEEEFYDWLYEDLPFYEPTPAEENNIPDKKNSDKSDKVNTPAQTKYGEYSNVVLSDTELDNLKSEFPLDWQKKIDRLSSYMASSGKNYHNHYATIKNWAKQDAGSQNEKTDLYRDEDSVDDLFGIGG